MDYWSSGVLEYWWGSSGVLEYYSVFLLASWWSTGVEYWGGGGIHLSPKRGRVREADAYHAHHDDDDCEVGKRF